LKFPKLKYVQFISALLKEKLKSVSIVNILLQKIFGLVLGFFGSSVARVGSLFLRKKLGNKNGERC
jgi:hypothetical protein